MITAMITGMIIPMTMAMPAIMDTGTIIAMTTAMIMIAGMSMGMGRGCWITAPVRPAPTRPASARPA